MRKHSRHTGTQDPDPKECRTIPVRAVILGPVREMFYCRIDNEDCKFAMPFGFDYICQHLNNHKFLTPLDEDHGKVVAMVLPDTDTTGKFLKR
jgi:hypothetical protein